MTGKILRLFKKAILLVLLSMFHHQVFAQAKTATIKLNKDVSYQKITGFGGFVNSPQFGYNHMTDDEIRKMWGQNSEAGYNIMRIYIPIGEENWPQALSTAQLAQSLGLKIFASPWSMPAEWKTYNTTASRYTDETGTVRPVYLAEEHYADYAQYLDNFVTYLKTNNVDLYAISLQNEPDYQVDYAGCIWTPAQMAKFIKEQGAKINCKVIAPESVGITDTYANAFLDPAVLANFEIFGGHQYGAIQPGLLNVQAHGKEVWMTEFLINWNSSGTARNYNWQSEAFDFATKINDAMLANVNAWVHYATKRYYGMMGDGQFGTVAGEINKRGNILSHYAKYVTGSQRIQNTWNDNTGQLSGSSYLSEAGDKVFVMVINSSANSYNLSVDLPFLSTSGKAITTTETTSLVENNITFTGETARPIVTIGASSITTLVFDKSGEREVSKMVSQLINYQKIESQTVTNPTFGTAYQLSGKTAGHKVDMPLFSANKDASNGFLQLTGKFNRLVFRVESLSSSNLYTSSNATLYYVNKAGAVASHNYGTINFARRDNFDWVFDISEDVLPDGITGIISMYNNNFSSLLTFKFQDVYLAVGSEKGYKFSGIYGDSDSYLLDCLDDPGYTSLDFTEATDIDPQTDWHAAAANKNSVFYTPSSVLNNKTNVVNGTIAEKLELSDMGGDFYPPMGFTATSATYSVTLNGMRMLVLPFESNIPTGVKAYTLEFADPKVVGKIITTSKIPANTPVLVNGVGAFTFEGTGAIASSANLRQGSANGEIQASAARNMQVGITGGVFIAIKTPVNGYYLTNNNGTVTFTRATGASQPTINSFGAYLALGLPTTATSLELTLDESALPVRLGMFNAKFIENSVRLDWTTYSEENNAGFDIERSTDAKRFEKIAFIEGKVNSTSENHYTATDPLPLAGISYYRLKQTDLDGTYAYSQVKSVNNTYAMPVVIYPNPVRDMLTIDLKGNKVAGKLTILNMLGQEIRQTDLKGNGQNIIDVSALSPGMYLYRLDNFTGSFVRD
ncbi:T9SS type A sorting domain-containing protein [Dyadobacter sp. CY345]|uniref:T9SS type A sorting domain-containing protein n=1 Tax=Dyadobacter sp. CY345 TaxID=2909335 RepID=UPI001F23B145|nr:T9SS type A sorting domain-containing protein [Dyadobacter sp. CY345]MCF2444015.1 T9SS type A sorting domain-containing protein [Dyadobacter sp. CY345]